MISLKIITITIAITFVLKHLQNANKTHLHGLMYVHFQMQKNQCKKTKLLYEYTSMQKNEITNL